MNSWKRPWRELWKKNTQVTQAQGRAPRPEAAANPSVLHDMARTWWWPPALAAHCFGNPSAAAVAERPDSMKALDAVGQRGGGSEAEAPAPLRAADVRALCEGGSQDACLAYGLMAMEGQAGVKQDMQHAADVLRRNCDAGNANSCFFVARLYDGVVGLDGRGLPRSPAQAASHYRRACDGGVGQACFNFAQMLDQGKVPALAGGGGSDRQLQRRVAKFFSLACGHGVAKGCVNLGVMQLDGIAGAASREGDAVKVFRGACQMSEGAGCAFAADVAAAKGDPASRAEAAQLYYEGCRLAHARSCMAQGHMLNQAAADAVADGSVKGEHAMHAKARAIMFFRRACELGDAQGCRRFLKSRDALKVLDTRSEDEKAWLNVTPEEGSEVRSPASLQQAVYGAK